MKDLESLDKNATTTLRIPMVLPHELLWYLVVAWFLQSIHSKSFVLEGFCDQVCAMYLANTYWFLFHPQPMTALHASITKCFSQESRKISWRRADVAQYWDHWRAHVPATHPAAAEGQHIPIGVSGDDAKYTLAGAKIIVMMLSFVVQNTMRILFKK